MNKLYEESSIQAIADAIRKKLGTDDKYTVSQMPEAILLISGTGTEDVTGGESVRTEVPQTGTWQLKDTTNKKYVIFGTDDDNQGNAKFFRMLRTYGFKYTMNVEAECATTSRDLGTDVDTDIFTDGDAPAIFESGTNTIELGKYLHDNNLGEVAQHGASAKVLWDSEKLTGDFLTSLHATYTEAGGTKTEEELRTAIMEALADTDGSQGASYVDTSRAALEEAFGFYIDTVGLWGGSPTAVVDGVSLDLNSIKGTTNYNWREHNYVAVSPKIGDFKDNTTLYDLSRITDSPANTINYINQMKAGKVCEFFWHMPFNDEQDISVWRAMFSAVKELVDNGEVEVVTRREYADLGEYVDNPITKITVSRATITVGETDDKNQYTVTATYSDSTTADVSSEAILDISAVDTTQAGNYTIKAVYRGFTTTFDVAVVDSYTVPDGLKSTDYWFVAKNNTQGTMFCGNTTGKFGIAANSGEVLKFTNCSSGKMNGWLSSDDGETWTQVNNNIAHYATIATNSTTIDGGAFAFGNAAYDSITFLESSGNFEITY